MARNNATPVRLMKKEKFELTPFEKTLSYYREHVVEACRDLLFVDPIWFQRIQLREMFTKTHCLMKWGRGTSKCAVGTAPIYDYDTMTYTTHEAVSGKMITTLGLVEDYKLGPVKAIIEPNGIQTCFKIQLRSGKSLEVTEEHPLLRVDGWIPTKDLKVGDRVGTARVMPGGNKNFDIELSRLLGYLIGDGGITKAIVFTNKEKSILDDYRAILLSKFSDYKLSETKKSKATSIRVTHNYNNQIIKWLRELELFGCTSHTKFIPNECYTWNNGAIANLIGAYFDCDGHINKTSNTIVMTSISERLLKDIQRLLLRFGIISGIVKQKTSWTYKGIKKTSFAYKLVISGIDNVKTFVSDIPSISGKYDNLDLNKVANTNLDTIPKEIWNVYREKYDIKLRSRSHSRRFKSSYSPSRHTLKEFGKEFNVHDAIDLANSDIFWDEIVSIENIGEHETYAVEVPIYHNYLIDTIITHNTYTCGLYAVLRCMLYPNCKIGIIGPSFRQTGYVFDVINEIFRNSPFFRASTIDGRIKRTTERCFVEFNNGSSIEGLPIGTDGAKIRGRRYTIVILDEYAYHNKETIDLVVLPFLTVMRDNRANQIIMCSTPSYKTNHFYEKYQTYKKNSLDPMKSHDYSCTSFNFVDVLIANHPRFKIDLNYVYENFIDQTTDDFLMEYGGYFPSETSSFFSGSLISYCEPRTPPIEMEEEGDPKAIYVAGLDAAREQAGDNASLVILKLVSNNIRHVVKVMASKGRTFPELHDLVREQMHLKNFNIVKIFLDYGGGGRAVADLMAQGWHKDGVKYKPIVEDTNEPNGNILPIMKLINFNAATIDYMFNSVKGDMEHKKILFPLTIRRDPDPIVEKNGLQFAYLKSEMQHLSPVPGTRGLTFEPHPKLGKDRITALVLANYSANAVYRSELGVQETIKNIIPIGLWS